MLQNAELIPKLWVFIVRVVNDPVWNQMILFGIISTFSIAPDHILSMSDVNWGPQDASQSRTQLELPLFASRSMSAYSVDLFGPLHWLSKH